MLALLVFLEFGRFEKWVKLLLICNGEFKFFSVAACVFLFKPLNSEVDEFCSIKKI